jgi:hypothetical protein
MRVSSSEIMLTVKAKPSAYPADVPWLPARSLSLSESWNPQPDHAQVGDSLTRRLTVKAEGLASSQLPPLPATDVNGLRRYPDQPVLGNQNSERGLIGSREDREALVPTRSGAIELPGVEVTWWNTFEDHLEHSSLPAQTLQEANNPSLMVDTTTGTSPVPDLRLQHCAGLRPVVARPLATGHPAYRANRPEPAQRARRPQARLSGQ